MSRAAGKVEGHVYSLMRSVIFGDDGGAAFF